MVEKPILLAARIPFLGGALLTFAALAITFITALGLGGLAVYFEQNPTGFIFAGFPIYLIVFPYFIVGFVLLSEDFWMFFGIYKIFGWKKNWVKTAILRALA